MTKALQTLNDEQNALAIAGENLKTIIQANPDTDFAYYVDLGLQQCAKDISEVQAAIKLIESNSKK